MTFAVVSDLLAAVDVARNYRVIRSGASNGGVAGSFVSSWRLVGGPLAVAVPPGGSGAALDKSSIGAIQFVGAGAGKVLYLVRADVFVNAAPYRNGGVYLFDRLVHTSGLDSTVTTEQTVNSVALPARAGAGVGVELWVEITTSTGVGTPTVTARYTNSDGVANRVSQAMSYPSSFRSTGATLRLPLQAGDVGVQSVQGFTFSAATTIAGNLGITLRKRVCALDSVPNIYDARGALSVGFPPLDDQACLEILECASSGGDAPGLDVTLYLAEA